MGLELELQIELGVVGVSDRVRDKVRSKVRDTTRVRDMLGWLGLGLGIGG